MSFPEDFIQKVVTQLGRHSVDVDALSGRQLEQLADSIADALQMVDSEAAVGARLRGPQREVKREPVPTSSLPEDASLQGTTPSVGGAIVSVPE